jgi:hypothetical protein
MTEVQKEAFFDGHMVKVIEHDEDEGEYSLINGEWIWIRRHDQ